MNNNDVQIKDLLHEVDQKWSSMGSKKRQVLCTNGIFKFNDGTHFNINVADEDVIVDAMRVLIIYESAHKEACRRLGVEKKFKWCGYSIDDWEDDFKNRIECIQFDQKKKLITSTKKRLEGLVSSEGKTAMEIEAIKASILNI